jgi:hypothetical protein
MAIARDPHIIPRVHSYCDEWCECCAVTKRCLAFRCRTEFCRTHGRRADSPLNAADAIQFNRELAAVEPPAPAAVSDRRRSSVDPAADDALVSVALDYATSSGGFVERCRASVPASSQQAWPAPHDVVLRFRSRIYFKTTHALVGLALTASGTLRRRGDADACAARVLAYAARSRTALAQFPNGDDRRALLAMLDAIVHGLEERFPDARELSHLAPVAAAAERNAPRTTGTAKFDFADTELAGRPR